jgi:patatin-related protein
MRDKELRLALVCYGGISLAVYMHGVTKEVWRLAQASRMHHEPPSADSARTNLYCDLFAFIRTHGEIDLRVLPDIIAGASAGGINGIFLAQAIATGQTLEPLTDLWLNNADVDKLLDPDAKPDSGFTKFWATPLAWVALRKPGGVVDQTVSQEAREEVRTKLSSFIRSRWFEPPFGGAGFTNLLLDAFDSMATGPTGARLLPDGQPLDLFVTVTDFHGYPARLRLNTPVESYENEHRLTLSFRQSDRSGSLGDAAELAFAARATASFPGAFPPFSVAELDGVLTSRKRDWPGRMPFLSRILGGHKDPESAVLIDGSVLANAPFEPAIAALKDRPARREVDRRFVYIDPKPGIRAVRLTKKGRDELPGFIGTIFGAISDIPREQPIRDSLEVIEERSARIRRLQRVVEAVRPSVELAIEQLFGRTFFLDRPSEGRLEAWRQKAQIGAAREAGYGFAAYGHMKLSGIVEDVAALVARQDPTLRSTGFETFRAQLWSEVRARKADTVWLTNGKGASPEAIAFFRTHDLGFRIRRIRFVIRTLANLVADGRLDEAGVAPLRIVLFDLLAAYLDRQGLGFYQPFDRSSAKALLDDVARQRGLSELDAATDAKLAEAFGSCPKAERRVVLFAYLGFPYFDISTLPMLQGEGLDEFDPIKVDRISPEDAVSIRSGGVAATLKGIEFNSFGAFFSRAYRENDYLWGRLHGADRLFDIVCSAVPGLPGLEHDELRRLKRDLLLAILSEEEDRLTHLPTLFEQLRREIELSDLGDLKAQRVTAKK